MAMDSEANVVRFSASWCKFFQRGDEPYALTARWQYFGHGIWLLVDEREEYRPGREIAVIYKLTNGFSLHFLGKRREYVTIRTALKAARRYFADSPSGRIKR